MEVEVEEQMIEPEAKFVDQLVRMILGCTAGFLASKLAEGAYDKVVLGRRHTS